MADADNFQTFGTLGTDDTNPVGDAPENDGGERDDDELVRSANDKIAKWQAASGIPSLTQVQELFHESICAGASPMARDKIVAAIMAAFDAQLGGKRALGSTWNSNRKAVRASGARETWRHQTSCIDIGREGRTAGSAMARGERARASARLDGSNGSAGTGHGRRKRTRADRVDLHCRHKPRTGASG